MPEALQQVRDDLGENAVILNTRKIRRNSRFNPHRETRVEVTAAFDESATAPRPAEEAPAPSLAARRYGLRAGATPPAPEEPPRQDPAPLGAPPAGSQPAVRSEGLEQVLQQLRQLREAVIRMEGRSPAGVVLPETLERLARRMHSTGLAPELVDELVQQLFRELGGEALEDRVQVGERATALLRSRLPECRDIKVGRRRKVIGFLGSAGAGKTTAAAKIAAGFAMKRRNRIVLVSADDQRVGALDQVRAFAQIIGVPLEVAYTEEEIRTVLDRHGKAQLVLIDSAGCGPHNHRERERQRRLFDAAGVDEVQVVIDGLSSLDHMLDQIEASEVFPERRLLFTKMDEVVRSGAVLSAAVRSQVPTSYFIVGATVPGEIEAGGLAKLVGEMIGVPAVSRKKKGK